MNKNKLLHYAFFGLFLIFPLTLGDSTNTSTTDEALDAERDDTVYPTQCPCDEEYYGEAGCPCQIALWFLLVAAACVPLLYFIGTPCVIMKDIRLKKAMDEDEHSSDGEAIEKHAESLYVPDEAAEAAKKVEKQKALLEKDRYEVARRQKFEHGLVRKYVKEPHAKFADFETAGTLLDASKLLELCEAREKSGLKATIDIVSSIPSMMKAVDEKVGQRHLTVVGYCPRPDVYCKSDETFMPVFQNGNNERIPNFFHNGNSMIDFFGNYIYISQEWLPFTELRANHEGIELNWPWLFFKSLLYDNLIGTIIVFRTGTQSTFLKQLGPLGKYIYAKHFASDGTYDYGFRYRTMRESFLAAQTFDTYEMELEWYNSAFVETRRLWIIALDDFPYADDKESIMKMLNMLSLIMYQQLRDWKNADKYKNVLIQDATGQVKGPAMAALLIAYQQWAYYKKINLEMTWKAVRNCRYRCMEMPLETFVEINASIIATLGFAAGCMKQYLKQVQEDRHQIVGAKLVQKMHTWEWHDLVGEHRKQKDFNQKFVDCKMSWMADPARHPEWYRRDLEQKKRVKEAEGRQQYDVKAKDEIEGIAALYQRMDMVRPDAKDGDKGKQAKDRGKQPKNF